MLKAGTIFLLALALTFTLPAPAIAQDRGGVTVIPSSKNDVSPLLATIPPKTEDSAQPKRERPLHGFPGATMGAPDTAVQSTVSTAAPAASSSFEGIGQGFAGFTVQYAPPDTNGAVGPNNFVQTVNVAFAVFGKTGSLLYGPAKINTLFTGFGGLCETDNDGDPSVVYDQLADRWLITQFAVSGANGSSVPYLECIAISTSGDPAGTYYRYSFPRSYFPDYPKLGLWPDAYYMSTNDFSGNSFAGATTWAFDRAKMLAGAAATAQLFHLSLLYGGLLPATLDGGTLPPDGSPNYFLALNDSSSLALWKFHVDFANSANSTLTGPITIPVAGYTELCNGGTCVPQAGTTQQLDSLADRVMYRLAYRNFGDHEALVVNHSVTAGSSTGVRWYELRPSGGNLTVFQQGTYAPDASYRWMGSIAMDEAGGIGLGFSVSSSSLKPQIHYAGRLASDPAGQMSQGEGTIINGAGVQTGRGLSRWGDYSSMSIDPVDGCTFWYASEYIPANGSFNWSTRIGTFKLPGCGVTNDFSISANPSSVSATQNGTATSTIATAVTSGSAQTVSLSASGLPSGATASFSPASVTAGGSSTLTLGAGTAAAGTYTVTVTGSGTSATHNTTVSFTITAPVTNDFSISASPASLSLVQGANGTSTISTAVTSGTAETVDLTVSGTPAGATATLSPTSVMAGGASTLTVGAGTAAPGTYTL